MIYEYVAYFGDLGETSEYKSSEKDFKPWVPSPTWKWAYEINLTDIHVQVID